MGCAVLNRWPRRLLVAMFLFTCSLGVSAAHSGREPGEQTRRKVATHTVTMRGMSFEPAGLTLRAGDTIIYVNKDVVSHTATSQAGGFDSRGIPPGKSWKVTPRTKGDFAYICSFHPTMQGKMTVK